LGLQQFVDLKLSGHESQSPDADVNKRTVPTNGRSWARFAFCRTGQSLLF
jgi:hypothetical protein